MSQAKEHDAGDESVPNLDSLRDHLLNNGPQNANQIDSIDAKQDDNSESVKNSHVSDSQDSAHQQRQDAIDRAEFAKPHPPAKIILRSPDKPSRASAAMAGMNPDAGGDTQIMDTQVFRDYQAANGIAETPGQKELAFDETPLRQDYGMDSVTDLGMRNSLEEDGSLIDLVGPLPANFAGQDDDAVSEDMALSPMIEVRRAPSQATGFAMPETPQIAGHKRTNDGQMVSSTTRDTPGLLAAFGPAKTPMISATQLFQQTQAPSSPLPDGPRSDPVLSRPSPNFQEDMLMPSMLFNSSSPAYVRQKVPSSTEPRQYVSMRESQETRRQMRENRPLSTMYEFDEEQGEIMRQARTKSKRTKSLESKRILQQSTAPDRATSVPGDVVLESSKGLASSKQDDPARKSPVPAMVITDQHADPTAVADHPTPLEVEDDDEMNNDQYDEYAQIIRQTQPDGHEDAEMVDVDNGPDQTEHAGTEDVMPRISGTPNYTGHVLHTAHPVLIGSSQGGQQAERRSLLAPPRPSASSNPTIIPGSQYLTASQELGRGNVVHSDISSAPVVGPTSTPSEHESDTVPSSPPLLHEETSTSNDGTRAVVHSEISAPAAQRRESASYAHSRGIPDSEAYDTSSKPDPSGRGDDDSANPKIFSTARSHLSPVRSKMASLRDAMISQDSVPSPLRAAGALRFNDLMSGLGPGTGEESLDYGEMMGDVITNDDREYLQALSSPAAPKSKKRRKQAHTIMSSEPVPDDVAQVEPGKVNARSQPSRGTVLPSDALQSSNAVAALTGRDVQQRPAVAVLATPQSKALTSEMQHEDAVNNPPSSAPAQDQPGAKSMTERPDPTPTELFSPATKLSGPGRRTYARKGRRSETATKAVAESEEAAAEQSRDETHQVPELPAKSRVHAQTDDDHVATTVTQIVAPKRVLALVGGKYNAYYTATITETPEPDQPIAVQYDDTSTGKVKPTDILPMDLRIGDAVRIDMPDMRKSVWVIHAFGQVEEAERSQTSATDIYGRSTVKVAAKTSQRHSLPDAALPDESEMIEVKISCIYIQRGQIHAFMTRAVEPPRLTELLLPMSSKIKQKSSSLPNTPVKHSRRSHNPIKSPISSSAVEEIRTAPSISAQGLFQHMAFAVSFQNEGDDTKRKVIRDIKSNGGLLLEDGFDELFEASEPTKDDEKHGGADLVIKSQYSTLGFVALIADRHSRRVKYMQALALGIPVLSFRWIEDTLTQQAEPEHLPWSRYLLPAGESSYLGGAIRSRTLEAHVPGDAQFANTIANRELLLSGDKILVVAQKGRNSSWEKRRPYTFLTLAMGAGTVRRVADLEAAKAMIKDDGSWRWVYVDGDISVAAEHLFGNGKGKKGNKRKSGGDKSSTSDLVVRSKDGQLAVVSDEFVVQSLILGALIG